MQAAAGNRISCLMTFPQASLIYEATVCQIIYGGGGQWRRLGRNVLGLEGPFWSLTDRRLHMRPERIRSNMKFCMTRRGHDEDDRPYHRHRYFQGSFGCI